MDQKELNQVALDFIHNQGIEVATKLRETLLCDVKERSEQVSWQALHHIHNMALFECLVWLNSMLSLDEDISEESFNEYLCFVETLRPKFLDIIEALKDFQPTK